MRILISIIILVSIYTCSSTKNVQVAFDFNKIEMFIDTISEISSFDTLESIILYNDVERFNFKSKDRYTQFILSNTDTISRFKNHVNYYNYNNGIKHFNLNYKQFSYLINALRENNILLYRPDDGIYFFALWRFIDNENGFVYNKTDIDLKDRNHFFRSGKFNFKKINDKWYSYSIR